MKHKSLASPLNKGEFLHEVNGKLAFCWKRDGSMFYHKSEVVVAYNANHSTNTQGVVSKCVVFVIYACLYVAGTHSSVP